jgi:hypothetical protein
MSMSMFYIYALTCVFCIGQESSMSIFSKSFLSVEFGNSVEFPNETVWGWGVGGVGGALHKHKEEHMYGIEYED